MEPSVEKSIHNSGWQPRGTHPRFPKLEDHILSIDISTPLSVDFYLKRTAILWLAAYTTKAG